MPKNLYLQLVPSDLLKFLAYVAGAVGGNENWSSVLSDLQTYTARKIIQNTREDDVHSAKKFLDTSVKLSRAKSPIFLEIFCIRYIKSTSGETSECLLYFDTKFVGIEWDLVIWIKTSTVWKTANVTIQHVHRSPMNMLYLQFLKTYPKWYSSVIYQPILQV